MPELEILAKRGITEAKLKELFTYPLKADSKVNDLVRRISGRSRDGANFSYTHWKLWQAIDALCETPFRQASTAILQHLAEKNPTGQDVLKQAEHWGLTHLIATRPDPKTGKPTPFLDVPRFFSVFVPLARAFSLVRAAKLTMDRMNIPLLKWEPPHDTPGQRLRCEIITERGELMTNQLGYRHQYQQVIRKTVEYGQQLQFIAENWYEDKQLGPDESEMVIREGLRFKLPHPSWTYFDQNMKPASFNTDSGCTYAGYWSIKKWSELSANPKLWNLQQVSWTNQNFTSPEALIFFENHGCVMSMPNMTLEWSRLSRETAVQGQLYSSSFADAPIAVTQHFEKINPKDYGIADYDYDVWFWFLLGAHDTVLYAAPLPGCPVTYWGYDTDDSRLFNVGMPLECAPWETAISNLFTQQLLSVKSNLSNLSFVNTDFVDEPTRKLIENLGQKYYTGVNLVPISGRQLTKAQQKVSEAVSSVNLPRHDINGIMSAVQMALNLMERCLGVSAQEVGSYASHQQSKEEIQVISQGSSVRLEYTGLGIDNATYAWKNQIYTYLMAYGKSEMYAHVEPGDVTKKQMEEMGFTVDEGGGKLWKISAPKSALRMESFASFREGKDRTNNLAIGTQMVQLLQSPLIGELLKVAGPQEMSRMINSIFDVLQLPRDWRLNIPDQTQGGPATQEWVMQQVVALAQKMSEAIQQTQQGLGEVQKGVGGAIQSIQQQVAQEIGPIAELIKKLTNQTLVNSASITELGNSVTALEQQNGQVLPMGIPPSAGAPISAAGIPDQAVALPPRAGAI